MLTLFIRAVILFAAAVAAMRVMGKRQVGQLQPYELVVAIMIAELAAAPMGDLGTPLLYGLLPMAALIICHGAVTFLCMRSVRFRGMISGQPTVLIRDGALCEEQLQRMSMTLSDLMESLRVAGFADVSEVGWAVLETSGQVTVFPKAAYRPVTPEDLHLSPEREGLPLPLILDGEVQRHNLTRGGFDERWLAEQLRQMGFSKPAEVLFMSLNTQGLLLAQGRGGDRMLMRRVIGPEEAKW